MEHHGTEVNPFQLVIHLVKYMFRWLEQKNYSFVISFSLVISDKRGVRGLWEGERENGERGGGGLHFQ